MGDSRARKKLERRRHGAQRAGSAARERPKPKEILEAAARTARESAGEFLRRDDLADRVVQLADGARSLALRVMRKSPDAERHECQPGCAFCCHTAVTVAAPEAFAIAAYLREHLTEDELAEVRERIDRNAELAASLPREAYIARLIPCGLLASDGNCRAHPVRPLPCAGFCSTSRAKCQAEFDRVPDREPVPADRFTQLAGLAVSNGLMDACGRAKVDGSFYELHHALRLVLDTPDAAHRWARGEDVFADCLK